jgi:hypothetical protein
MFSEDAYTPEPNTGCYLWLRCVGLDGYGKTSRAGKTLRAHRVAYADHYGVEPGEHQVLHRCDQPSCVNPEHLYLGTPLQNMQDKMVRGRWRNGLRPTKATRPDIAWKGWPKGVTWASKGLSRKGQGAGIPKPKSVF